MVSFFQVLSGWGILAVTDLLVTRDLLWVADHYYLERFLVNYGLSSLALVALLVLIRQYLTSTLKRKIVAFFILYIPIAIQSSYFNIYRKFVSSFGFRAFFEDPGMVFTLWTENLNPLKLTLTAVAVILVIRVLNKYRRKPHVVVPVLSGFTVIIITTLMVLSWYSVPLFQNSIVAYAGSYLELVKMKSYEQFKLDKPEVILPATEKKLPNIVYVIGESTVLSRMSLYGYERDTTPGLNRLEKNGAVVAFQNCISIGLQTRLSVPYMLAGLEGNDPKGYFYTVPTVFNYAKARGYSTAFISAQDFSWGRLKELLIDRDVDYFVNGTEINPNARVHKGADDLKVLEQSILPYIDSMREPYLLVVQMDGSHYPFTDHSEKQYKKFLPEETPNDTNSFDNTIVYTDLFLDKLISHIREMDNSAWLFFSPDHGQNLGGENGFFNDNFSSNVIHNPLIISPPEHAVETLRKNRNAPLSQADIVPTILSLMDIEPVKPVDGVSILNPVPNDRLRTCSTYMPTFHNVPEAVLVFHDLTYYLIDFQKLNVTLDNGETLIKFESLDKEYQDYLMKRL